MNKLKRKIKYKMSQLNKAKMIMMIINLSKIRI